MKSLRDSFEENYSPVEVPCNNKRGFRIQYEYIGPWYRWGTDSALIKREKRAIGNACAVSLILFLAGALKNSALNYSRYVELFGLLSVVAYIFEVVGTVQFCAAKDKVTNMNFADINGKLRLAPPAHALLLFCAAAACLAAGGQSGVLTADIGVPVCYLGAAAASLVIFHKYSRLSDSAEKEAVYK